MSVAAFCRAVRSQWQALAQLVWPEGPEQRTQAEVARLTEELYGRYRRLVLRRHRIEQLRDRLARQERELAGEPCGPAEHLRAALERNRARLAEHESAYARQRQAFLRRKRLRLALLRGQVVVSAARAPADEG